MKVYVCTETVEHIDLYERDFDGTRVKAVFRSEESALRFIKDEASATRQEFIERCVGLGPEWHCEWDETIPTRIEVGLYCDEDLDCEHVFDVVKKDCV